MGMVFTCWVFVVVCAIMVHDYCCVVAVRILVLVRILDDGHFFFCERIGVEHYFQL